VQGHDADVPFAPVSVSDALLSALEVDAEGEDSFVTFTVKVPTGSRDGDADDGYSMAQDYAMRQEEKKAKAEKAAADKARKIARDEKMRKQKAEARAAREGDGKGE
jgi:flagellar biosynthesis/type III secretory pathway protein FliH